jgi:hypothetical protein
MSQQGLRRGIGRQRWWGIEGTLPPPCRHGNNAVGAGGDTDSFFFFSFPFPAVPGGSLGGGMICNF